jgi:hypothetical protein
MAVVVVVPVPVLVLVVVASAVEGPFISLLSMEWVRLAVSVVSVVFVVRPVSTASPLLPGLRARP